jgi:dipeptidase D
VLTIHAGLECGIISEKLPTLDIISCGPIVLDLHSPDEALNIASLERFFTVIKNVIKEI